MIGGGTVREELTAGGEGRIEVKYREGTWRRRQVWVKISKSSSYMKKSS